MYDGGHTTFWSNDLTPVRDVRTRFHEPGMSHLGFGLPAAIALQVAASRQAGRQHHRRRRLRLHAATSLTPRAATACRWSPSSTTTPSWGVIRMGQKLGLDFEMGTALEDTDYAAIARGFGCHGEIVTRAGDMAGALARAIASGLPAVLDCRTKFLPHPAVAAFVSMNKYGFQALTRVEARQGERMNDIRMLIGGEKTAAASGKTFERRNPLDGRVATRAPAATPQDALSAVDAAAKAFPAWSAIGPGRAPGAAAEGGDGPRSEGAAVRRRRWPPRPAPRRRGPASTCTWPPACCRRRQRMTTQIGGEVIPSDVPGSLAMGLRVPAGVVLGIAPWNAPVILGVRAIATPLACGNTVVFKGSELCPATHGLIVEALQGGGLPARRRQLRHQRAGRRGRSGRGDGRAPGAAPRQLHRLHQASAS